MIMLKQKISSMLKELNEIFKMCHTYVSLKIVDHIHWILFLLSFLYDIGNTCVRPEVSV